MAKISIRNRVAAKWYKAEKDIPDDSRDVLAWVIKPVVVERGKAPRVRKVLCVVCFEGGFWYDDPNPRAQISSWTEIPEGGLHG